MLLACILLAVLPILPDDTLTPGEVGETSAKKVCVIGYSTTQRHTTDLAKETAYKEYGIKHVVKHDRLGHPIIDFEIDHRVPLELGGADTLWNLWPQSYLTQPWNAHKKDRLENALRRAVCIQHTMTLAEAQNVFLKNWITGYRKYVASAR